MKQGLIAFSFLFMSCILYAQQVSINAFTVKRELTANISDWKPDAMNAIVQASSQPGAAPKQVKLVLQVRKGSAMVCGNTAQSAQVIDNLTSKVIRTSDVISILGNCILQSGQYSLCIQVVNMDNRSLADQCREFTVPNVFDESIYKPPTLIAPANNSSINGTDARRPLTFRWTPVVPPPAGNDVIYHLRVYEILPGQQALQAARSNSPVFEKESPALQAIWQVPPEYNTSKETRNLVWTVQATTKAGKGYGSNNGTSEPFLFSISNTYSVDLQNLVVSCPQKNVYAFTIKVGNTNASIAIFDKLEVVMVNNVLITPINIPTTSPAIGSTIPANGNINVSASFPYGTNVTTVCIKAYIKEQANPTLNTASTYICDTLTCACDPCKDMGVTLKTDTVVTKATGSNEIILSGMLNGLDPNKIKKLTIELVYFNITQTGDKECAKCATNKEWGNFIMPSSSAFAGFGTGILNGPSFGRLWTWNSTITKECNGSSGGGNPGDHGDIGQPGPNKITQPNVVIITPPVSKLNSFSLPVALPAGSALSCCGDKIKICIRYTWWDFCCHACDIIKCYEIERKPAK